MGIPFSADEIYEMAEQIERNGAKFYRRAAELTEDEVTKKLLGDLASWEEGHEKRFAAMRADAASSGGITLEQGDEAALYLRAMADGRVFDVSSDPSERLTGQESTDEMLRMAIGLEKESIVFYVGVRDMVSDERGKDQIGAIIKEEMGHIVELDGKLGG